MLPTRSAGVVEALDWPPLWWSSPSRANSTLRDRHHLGWPTGDVGADDSVVSSVVPVHFTIGRALAPIALDSTRVGYLPGPIACPG